MMEIFKDEATKNALGQLCDFCLDHNYKITVAESVTSGLVQLMLSSCPNAGFFFAGGLTVYSCMQKFKQLGISNDMCQASSGVSEKISESMALQICKKFRSEVGMSITGFASPMPEKGIKELYAYASFCFKDKIIFTERLTPKGETQLDIQLDYASALLRLSAERIIQL
tara:strand:- start:933 stop:1439 length:507 start_codon:yes stop_codon:yes gene_type:complete